MKEVLNQLGKSRIPFLFIIDFNAENCYITPMNELKNDILFSIDGFSNTTDHWTPKVIPQLTIKKSIDFDRYSKAFALVLEEMRKGNTYLLNLTFPTEIIINLSLLEIFFLSQAPFKLYVKDQFVTFSPEQFIKIENGFIKTFPMKGTIDLAIPNAMQKILADTKEQAEHVMVVDLLRNDLSIVAKKVRLNRFRYVSKIKAGTRELLQVSSEISGILEPHWQDRIGDILLALLPAGSISGTPKKKTVEIIKTVESENRGFFTGVFGYFNGDSLDSAVMIRFIEKQGDKIFYKSGGGLTIDSDCTKEYQELLAKVYLPIVIE
ncbi:MAG: aminodeoxychorismate synthase component I [Beggiatoa sp. IS2]|nr:MAG: aminodeoxychorismate synthase component I [Beggiatoa sp. IS2]